MQYYDDFYDGLKDNRNILYRQIDTVSSLNKLLSTVCSELHNLKNYKINLTGENTLFYKEYLNNLINKWSSHDNEIQEVIKIKEGYPIYQLNDIENISLIKTLSSMDYKINTVITNIDNEFKIIKQLIKESIETATKEGDYSLVVKLSDMLLDANKVTARIP